MIKRLKTYAALSATVVVLTGCASGFNTPFNPAHGFLLRASPVSCNSYPNFADYKACLDKNAAFGKQLNEKFSQNTPANATK